jgi:peroxidase
VSVPRISVTGQPLPSARIVSAMVHRDLGYHDQAITTFLPAWGQMIDHDMARGADTIDPKTRAEPNCCQVQDPKQRHPACFPVEVPQDDPFYSKFRLSCLNLVRTATGLKDFCRLGKEMLNSFPLEPFNKLIFVNEGARGGLNAVSSYLDASHVYGLTEDVAISLREMRGGLLRTNKDLRSKGLKDLLPPKTVDPDQNCNRPSPDKFCFLAGKNRY